MTEPLPLWRAIAGFAVLGSLILIFVAIVPAYLGNYRLKQYAQSLSARADSSTAPDEALQADIAARARQFNLILPPGDVHVKRAGGKVQFQIARHKARVFVLDLHFGETSTR